MALRPATTSRGATFYVIRSQSMQSLPAHWAPRGSGRLRVVPEEDEMLGFPDRAKPDHPVGLE
jgi:hypothetical protein